MRTGKFTVECPCPEPFRINYEFAAYPYLHRPTPSHPFVGLAVAKNDGIAGLKPESLIFLSEFDTREYLRLQLILSRLIGLVKI